MFRMIDANSDNVIAKQQWMAVFSNTDENADGIISRKEWYLKNGSSSVFDAIPKVHKEWLAAFEHFDVDGKGFIKASE